MRVLIDMLAAGIPDPTKVNVYLRDAGDFQEMNRVYMTFWPEEPPARTTVQAIGESLCR